MPGPGRMTAEWLKNVKWYTCLNSWDSRIRGAYTLKLMNYSDKCYCSQIIVVPQGKTFSISNFYPYSVTATRIPFILE